MSKKPAAGKAGNPLVADAQIDAVLDAPAEKPDYNAENADELLEEAGRRFQATQNGVWAWYAIKLCLGRHDGLQTAGRPLPEWLQDYLAVSASDIIALANLNDPVKRPSESEFGGDHLRYGEALQVWRTKKIAPKEAPNQALKTLHLGGDGKNLFTAWRLEIEAILMAAYAGLFGRDAAKSFPLRSLSPSRTDAIIALGRKIRPEILNRDNSGDIGK